MYGPPLERPPGLPPNVNATAGGETAMDMHLSPSSSIIGFDDLTIYRIGEGMFTGNSLVNKGSAYVTLQKRWPHHQPYLSVQRVQCPRCSPFGSTQVLLGLACSMLCWHCSHLPIKTRLRGMTKRCWTCLWLASWQCKSRFTTSLV